MNTDSFSPAFEALLRQALLDNINERIAAIPPDDELDTMFTLSAEHDERMRKLCAREDRKDRIRVAMHPLRRVAVFVLIMFFVLFGVLMTSPDVRAAVKEVIIEWYDQFTRFTGNPSEVSIDNATETVNWSPSFLPDGYFEVGFYDGETPTTEYENGEGMLLLFKYSIAENELLVDNEETVYAEVPDEGIIYYVFEATDARKSNRVVWVREGYSFFLNGYVDTDILLETAKSVE